ncbi:MAG: ROK family protein [Phycisphaerae bacterium]
MGKSGKSSNLYMGVDVGGTKIQATLVEESGSVLARNRRPTPREVSPEQSVEAIASAVADLLGEEKIAPDDLAAIGIAVPGVVDPDAGVVVVTPNMALSGVSIVPRLEERFGVPVALGNDTNMGALGERWLGAGRDADSVLGVFVGTGIGGGFVQGTALMRGYRGSACEVGHMIMEINGPLCGCGNRGCMEALASRTAIERDIRMRIASGEKSVVTELMGEDARVIRSGVLRDALTEGDEVVTGVLHRASEVLGLGLLTIRHVLDPEVTVLGGGVVEACGSFMLPIVQGILDADALAGSRPPRPVRLAALGDDAVAMGAVALAREAAGRSVFSKKYQTLPEYPKIESANPGEVVIGGKSYSRDARIHVNGKSKGRKKSLVQGLEEPGPHVGLREVRKVCKGGPEVLFIGIGFDQPVAVSEEAVRFCRDRHMECEIGPTGEIVEAYNCCKRRKAALLRVYS